jgi:hypothetical protein
MSLFLLSLFLLAFPALLFFFLCSTAYSGEAKDSIAVFLRGLALSFPVFLLLYLFRNLIVDQPGSASGFFFSWFYDFFLYLAVGVGVFSLVPSYRDAYADRSRRLESFLFGVFALSGIATLIQQPYLRDSYYLFMLPVLRVCILLLMSRLMHIALGEYGLRLGLFIAAAVLMSFIPAFVAFFHFWKLGLASLGVFILVVGVSIFIDRNEIAAIFHKELRAFREGRF